MENNKKKGMFFICCAIFIILGVIFIIVAINEDNSNKHLIEVCTGETVGTITDYHLTNYYEEDNYGDKIERTRYYPIFEYEINGETYSKQYEMGEDSKRFKIGEKITVMYDPANLDEYYVLEDMNTEGYRAGIYVGIVMIVLGVLFLVMNFVRNKKNKE